MGVCRAEKNPSPLHKIYVKNLLKFSLSKPRRMRSLLNQPLSCFLKIMDTAIKKRNTPIYQHLIFLLIFLTIIVGAGWSVVDYLEYRARREIIMGNENAVSILSLSFTYTMKEIAGAVEALSGSPWIAPALISRRDRDIAKANSVLDRYNSSLGVSVSYLIDRKGLTIASSNRKAPDSFVGQSYRFRPYFMEAMEGKRGQYFALGVTSGKRGAYASNPVRDENGKIIGVAVIKKDLDEIETYLRNYPFGSIVDQHGIIFLSSKKEMLFKSLWPVNREIEKALIVSRQFGDKPFHALLPREVKDGMTVELDGTDYYVSRAALNAEGWSLVLMAPTDKIFLYKLIGLITIVLLCALVIILTVISYMTFRAMERKRVQKTLQESEAKYYDLYENAPDMYLSVDAKTTVILGCNNTLVLVTGYAKEEIIGRSVFDMFQPDCVAEAKIAFQHFTVTGEVRNAERQIKRKDGSALFVSLNSSAVRDMDGTILYSRSIWRDITERKQYEQMINSLAITDQLTGLYNRRGFITLAEQQLKQSQRKKERILLLFADLDNMKEINDNLGHKKGDDVLVETADVLKKVFRKMDIIGRIGGDEFAVLAIEGSPEDSDIIKKRLQDQIDNYNSRSGRAYRLSISTGMAYYDPLNPTSLDELMSRADSLMYEQKKGMRGAPNSVGVET